MRSALALALLSLLAGSSARAAGRLKIAVMPAQFDLVAKDKVPSLFDDHVLTAVQNAGAFDVIGPEDIASMLALEQQKQAAQCDDAACMADLGGALGVDEIVTVKVALLEADWVVTAKRINIKFARVEARTSQIVSGPVKALLEAVPQVARVLFSQNVAPPPETAAPASHSTQAPPPAVDDKSMARKDPMQQPSPGPAAQVFVERPKRNWLLIGAGAATLLGGVVMDILPYGEKNELEAGDFIPVGFYLTGGVLVVLGL